MERREKTERERWREREDREREKKSVGGLWRERWREVERERVVLKEWGECGKDG
ncbi:MAG: hypothetical protein P4L61_01630 [Candidatus Pacebacteria bacterium]|nr:hypothetical protein [Candidatus Paceibacterota bacterium]